MKVSIMFMIIPIISLWVVKVQCSGMTTHNIVARRTSQFEYFGPQSEYFRPENFYGLAESRPDAIQV